VIRGGHKYSIVNITTASREVLGDEVRRVLRTNPFRGCLAQAFKPGAGLGQGNIANQHILGTFMTCYLPKLSKPGHWS